MAFIGRNMRDLRNFFDESNYKIVGPVIQMKSGLILQTACQGSGGSGKILRNYRPFWQWISKMMV